MKVKTLACLLLPAVLAGCGPAGRSVPSKTELALGQKIYASHCAQCHGAALEGQPAWRQRQPNGRLPAPPHDDTGHTWHHSDQVLFEITRNGVVPPNAPPGYQSDMPAFAGTLSDDQIRAVLAFIASRWSKEAVAAREQMLKNARR